MLLMPLSASSARIQVAKVGVYNLPKSKRKPPPFFLDLLVSRKSSSIFFLSFTNYLEPIK
jgi:hypothetical protein